MSWVSIDYDRCTNCGICIEGCGRCFYEKEGKVSVSADINCCSICGRCVSLCPSGAVKHSEMDMENFGKIERDFFISTDDFIEFLRQRRSHRAFQKKDIPEPDIRKLVDIIRYSPTGSNSQIVELLVVRNQEKIKKLSDMTVRVMVNNGMESEKKARQLREEGKAGQEEIAVLEMMALYGQILKEGSESGQDPIFYGAPAVMIFHAPDSGFSKKDDCVIASTTMGLLSRTMGLEYTYIGLFEGAANSDSAVMEELGLPAGNNVFSVIILGYPVMKFYRTVDRKPLSVRWE